MAIDGKDIIKDDALDNHIAQLKEVLKLNEEINAQIVKTAKASKTASSKVGSGKEAKGIRDLTKALSESELAKRAALKIDKDKQKLDIQLKALNSEKIAQNDILKRQVQDQTKTNKEIAESTRRLVGTEEKLIAANKKLLAERKKLDTSTAKGQKRLKALNSELDRNNKVLEKNSDRLGKQRIGIGRYSKAIGGLRSGLAQLGLAFGVFTLIKDSFNVIKDFDQAQANLSSVLGVTRDEMSALTEQSKLLGETTKFTASQVAELQLEYAKLGFTQKEIEDVTEATLQLAAAAGTDLANAATIVGSTLRAFGLDTSETQRLVDVMAKSFSASSLDIDKFSSAMANVAPAAKSMGLSIEETTALIGTLTDSGIDASAAGTGLRNMFLDSLKQGIDFADALDEINNSTNKLKTSFDIFGKKGSVLGVILAENQQATAKLTSTLENAGGAAEEMADKQLDTLGGAIDLLKSAWEGLILKFNEGTGASEFLKNAIKFLAENLVQIVSIISKVLIVFGTYKVALRVAALANKVFGGSLSKMKSQFGAIGIAVSALIIIVSSLVDNYKNAARAGKALEEVTDEVTDRMIEEKVELTLLTKEMLRATAGSKERQKVIDEINDKYGLTLQNLSDEAEFVNQVTLAYQALSQQLRIKIEIEVIGEKLKEEVRKVFDLKEALRKEGESIFGSPLTAGFIQDDIDKTEEGIDILTKRMFELQNIGGGGLKGRAGSAGLAARNKELEEIKAANGKELTEEEKKINRLVLLRERQAKERLEFENLLIEAGFERNVIEKELSDQRIEQFQFEQKFIIDLQFESDQIQIDARNKQLKFIESVNEEIIKSDIERINAPLDEFVKGQSIFDAVFKKVGERLQKERKERIAELKKMRDESLAIFKEITDGLAANIDKRIEERQREIDESTSEIARLQDLAAQGNIDAAESIKAERIAVAREKLEIEALEKKKRNLLITVAALERASQLIGQGSNDPFGEAGFEMSGFLSSLKSLSEGTDYNIGQTLGKAQRSGTDGHLAWVDKREKLLSVKNSEKLGGMHQDEVTRRALAYNNDFVSAKAITVAEYKAMTDVNIVNKLDNVEQAIKNMKFPTSIYDQKTGLEIVRHGNNISRYHHNPTIIKI